MAGIHVKFDIEPDEFLADLTEAAYNVALHHGFTTPFIDVEMDMMGALHKVIERDMSVTAQCGSIPECCHAIRVKPFTKQAEDIIEQAKVPKQKAS